MRRIVVALLAVATLVLPLGSSASVGGGRSAVVVGDSLAVGTEPYLPGLLPGWQLRQIAQKSVSTAYGIARLRALGATLPHYVVVSLGTNDDPRAVERFRAAIRTVLATAGSGRCVVWPNIVRPRTLGATYEGLNRVLSQEARANRRLRVVDWRGLTRLHPAWLREDGVHGTVAGYRGRAAAIARALAACG
jgi:lysophospholipase L1-like esterase